MATASSGLTATIMLAVVLVAVTESYPDTVKAVTVAVAKVATSISLVTMVPLIQAVAEAVHAIALALAMADQA